MRTGFSVLAWSAFGAVLLAGLAIAVTGCGSSPSQSAPAAPPTQAGSPAELAWIDNADGLISQLSDAVVVSAAGGSDLATARSSLHDDADMLAMVMASVAFGSCDESLRNVGVADRLVEAVEAKLATACRFLRQASDLFTRAVTRTDPHWLLVSARASGRASRFLREAKIRLDELRVELAPHA
jgi:hypothetical protein